MKRIHDLCLVVHNLTDQQLGAQAALVVQDIIDGDKEAWRDLDTIAEEASVRANDARKLLPVVTEEDQSHIDAVKAKYLAKFGRPLGG